MLRSSVVKPAGWGWSKANSQPSGHTVVETVDSEGESATAPGYRQSFRDAIATVFSNVSTDQGMYVCAVDSYTLGSVYN